MVDAPNRKQTLQTDLRALFAKAKLPSSPALAAQILELADNPNATIDDFAQLIKLDPVLSARLLQMANSAMFAQRNQVTTVQRAVSLLGMMRVRTIALGFQLIGHLDRLGGCSFNMKEFWQHSLLRGCMAREIASDVVPECADEAFLVGLLQDCGILLLVQLLGKEYASLFSGGRLTPTAFCAAEAERFGVTHVDAVTAMAREWRLPEPIVRPLAMHHTPVTVTASQDVEDRLAAVSYLVGSTPLEDELNPGQYEPALAAYAKAVLGLNDMAMQGCIRRAGQAYEHLGSMLKESLPDDLDVTDLLSQANNRLTGAADDAVKRISSAEAERDAYQREQVSLRNALGEYRERAARDPLTGVLNRGALTESCRERLRNVQENASPILVLFLDLDNFKRMNDTYGHSVGDAVLQATSQTLKEHVLNGGIVGRYGGEEFVVMIPGLTEGDARRYAQGVVADIREIRYVDLGLHDPITCSLGAVWGVPDRQTTSEALFAAADELMYEAKRTGKDRCCFRTLDMRDRVGALASGAAAAAAAADVISKQQKAPKEPGSVTSNFERIARELNASTPHRFLKMRKQPRKDLITPCIITAFTDSAFELSQEDAYVRNISTGGVGLLTNRPLFRGEPIEVSVMAHGSPCLYVAGLVAFCRHIENAVHEVGVQLYTHAKAPIFSENPIAAIRNMDWVAQALQSLTRIVSNAKTSTPRKGPADPVPAGTGNEEGY